MIQRFTFVEAGPLLQFIRKNRTKIVGQHIRGFYSAAPFGSISSSPVVFELDDYCLIMAYYWYSDLTVYIVNAKVLKRDLSLNFLYKEIPESRNLTNWVWKEDIPYIGQEITDICVKCFSRSFEINPSTGERRPDGGDYFSVITFMLSDNDEIHICAAPPTCDGYVEVW